MKVYEYQQFSGLTEKQMQDKIKQYPQPPYEVTIQSEGDGRWTVQVKMAKTKRNLKLQAAINLARAGGA